MQTMSQTIQISRRQQFNGGDLRAIHCLRARVFRDRMGWEVPVLAGMEIDVKLEMKSPEDVNVPAGNYKKVTPVEMIMNVQGQEIVATNFYAEGVGIIKQDINLAGNKITSALKKFTQAK